jgi:hypothetical protein
VLSVDLVGYGRICLLRLNASSIQADPDGSRRIVWMIKRMIKPQPTSTTQNLVRQRFGDERFQRLPGRCSGQQAAIRRFIDA